MCSLHLFVGAIRLGNQGAGSGERTRRMVTLKQMEVIL